MSAIVVVGNKLTNPSPCDIFHWQDGEWCFRDELEDLGWRQHNYTVLYVDTPEYTAFLKERETDGY